MGFLKGLKISEVLKNFGKIKGSKICENFFVGGAIEILVVFGRIT